MSSPETSVTKEADRRECEPRPRHGLDPVDVCIAAYLLLSGVLLLVTDPTAGHYVPLFVRALVLVVLFFLRRQPLPNGRALGFLRRAYPLALYPYFYAELAVLNQLVTGERYDALVIRWEAFIFGGQPSVELRERWPWTLLSEYLHLGYFSYYFVPTFTVVMLAARGKLTAVSETMTAVTLTFVACYAWFIFFPVVGPYHTFMPPDPEALGYVFPRLTHAIVRAGSTHGTAFPSSHVAVAVAVFIQAARYDRRTAWILAAFVPALVVGTVYGGFHYAVDALGGVILAGIVHASSRVVFRALETWRVRSVSRENGEADQRAAVARRC